MNSREESSTNSTRGEGAARRLASVSRQGATASASDKQPALSDRAPTVERLFPEMMMEAVVNESNMERAWPPSAVCLELPLRPAIRAAARSNGPVAPGRKSGRTAEPLAPTGSHWTNSLPGSDHAGNSFDDSFSTARIGLHRCDVCRSTSRMAARGPTGALSKRYQYRLPERRRIVNSVP